MFSLIVAIALSQVSFAQNCEVDVTLSPAGSFVGKTSSVSGHASLKGDTVVAKGIKVKLTDLKTGISLRDNHTQKHLETEKYPEAELLMGQGKAGKGKAKIKLRGKEKVVDGTYTLSSDKTKLDAKFPIVLSEFGITGIKYMGVGVKDEVMVRVQVPVKN
jgi:polyisoprenoid-binding protein YceI